MSGGKVTSTAGALVMLPAGPATTTVYSPASLVEMLPRVNVLVVRPNSGTPPCRHWYVSAGVPTAVTEKVTVPPVTFVRLTGWARIAGSITVRVATWLVAAPAGLLSTTV